MSHMSRPMGMTRRGPESRKTRPPMVRRVPANTALWTTGPRKAITDWALWISAYTEPAVSHTHTGK